MPDQRVRRAVESDVDAIVKLVYELAEYERTPQECHLTADQLHTALFDPSPALFAHVAEVDAEVVGCALWFLNFSTWDGVHGIYRRGPLRPAERQGLRAGQGVADRARRGVRAARVLPAPVVGAGLERSGDRLLHLTRRGANGRVDGVPGQW